MFNLFQMPSFDASCSVTSMGTSKKGTSRNMNSIRNSNHNTKIAMPGIGYATKLSSGYIRIDYNDGSVVIVNYCLNIIS